METSSVHHRRKSSSVLVFQKPYSLIAVLITISLHCVSIQIASAVSNPIGSRYSALLPPPQVLLPPHREEGQSLDDIIYGTSFSGSALSNFPFLKNAPVVVPRPSDQVSSTRSPPPPPPSSFTPTASSIRTNGNNFNRPLPPSPTPHHPSRPFSHSPNNVNLVQTFTPPSPPPSFSTPLFRPSSSSISASSSAEEIKVPQAVKHRTNRKQYTKADLIAAANSLKPAGFDFNKVLIVTPSNNHLNSSSATSGDATSIYERVMFPLPLFDTPVYNQLKPLMEMLIKANYNLGGSSGGSDNKKVLVIIPRGTINNFSKLSSGRVPPNGAITNPLLNNSKPPLKHNLQSSATTSSSSKSSPSSKFQVSPKSSIGKHATTQKPKSFSQGFSTTTKRASKLPSFPASPRSGKVTGKKSEKGPDLQAAATSNKLSQRPSSANSPSSDKRSFSSKGGDNYSFSYEVNNDAYKDVKSHRESRDGDSVAGEYSMLEADGYTRVVRYTVDSDQGFKASVKRIPPS